MQYILLPRRRTPWPSFVFGGSDLAGFTQVIEYGEEYITETGGTAQLQGAADANRQVRAFYGEDLPSADMAVTATVGGAQDLYCAAGPCARVAADNSTFYLATWSLGGGFGALALYRRNSGSWTELGRTSGTNSPAGDATVKLSCVTSGDDCNIVVYLNGASAISVADTSPISGVKCGMRFVAYQTEGAVTIDSLTTEAAT